MICNAKCMRNTGVLHDPTEKVDYLATDPHSVAELAQVPVAPVQRSQKEQDCPSDVVLVLQQVALLQQASDQQSQFEWSKIHHCLL
jgi:hypothetical protein